MKIHFRAIKNIAARPFHYFGYVLSGLPRGVGLAIMKCVGDLAKGWYFMPGSHLRKTVENFCRVAERPDPWPVFSTMISNIEESALHMGHLYRYGREDLLSQTTIDPFVQTELQRLIEKKRGVIILVPHCAGAVLSSAKLSTFCKTVLLVREPKDPGRCELMMRYMKKLGPELILARNTPPAVVIRGIVRALLEGKVVVGTTDLVKADADTIETRAFGQPLDSPAWPARLSARLGSPILPGYLDEDVQHSTQRWMSSFEKNFRRYPSDWAFMLDKRWARLLSAAAASAPEARASRPEYQHSFTSDQRTPQGR